MVHHIYLITYFNWLLCRFRLIQNIINKAKVHFLFPQKLFNKLTVKEKVHFFWEFSLLIQNPDVRQEHRCLSLLCVLSRL